MPAGWARLRGRAIRGRDDSPVHHHLLRFLHGLLHWKGHSMSENHTPGQLVAEELDQDDDFASVIRQVDGDPCPFHVAYCNLQGDARRIVACWNACTGFGTETLERLGALDRAKVNARITLRTQRDELLEALRSVHRWMDDQADGQSKGGHATFDLLMLREQRDIAAAAIAKVEGGAA